MNQPESTEEHFDVVPFMGAFVVNLSSPSFPIPLMGYISELTSFCLTLLVTCKLSLLSSVSVVTPVMRFSSPSCLKPRNTLRPIVLVCVKNEDLILFFFLTAQLFIEYVTKEV